MVSPYTGELLEFANDAEAEKSGFIPVRRDLSEIERAMKQIMLYEACMCGSGKKFKFCCHKDPLKETIQTTLSKHS